MAFDLSSIQKTRHASPPRIVVHGEEKCGKSTFFSGAPGAIFIPTEDGLNGVDAQAFPLCQSFDEVLDALQVLQREDHDFRTVVIDSMDWTERLIHRAICEEEHKDTIEQCAGGYGKGYQIANNKFKDLLTLLDDLNKRLGMMVGIICHSKIATVRDPMLEEFDRVQMKLHSPRSGNGIGDILNEWADVIGFAQIVKTITARSAKGFEGAKSYRAVGGGERVLHLQPSPGFVAGNRYNLPAEIPLQWSAFMEALTASTKED